MTEKCQNISKINFKVNYPFKSYWVKQIVFSINLNIIKPSHLVINNVQLSVKNITVLVLNIC